MMRHLIHFTDGRIQPLWAPGTPFRERFRLARAFRAFAEGLDPRDREGFFRFDVDTDGNAMVGGRARPGWGHPDADVLDDLFRAKRAAEGKFEWLAREPKPWA